MMLSPLVKFIAGIFRVSPGMRSAGDRSNPPVTEIITEGIGKLSCICERSEYQNDIRSYKINLIYITLLFNLHPIKFMAGNFDLLFLI